MVQTKKMSTPMPLTRRGLQGLKRRVRLGYMGSVLGIGLAVCVGAILIYGPRDLQHGSVSRMGTGDGFEERRLRILKNITSDPCNVTALGNQVSCDCNLKNYPQEIFSWEEKQSGAVALYIVGVLYMFVALAIVCDEFFVPALERIVEVADISDDVAGATFMAAGGSAPELFTSFMGVFASGSDVGFGTIIGSAVFNVLFVIGMCAIFSKELLELTWWPLFRDCTYYLISLVVLAVFFGVDYYGGKGEYAENYIEWWESLILFVMYMGYVTVMKFNVQLQGKVTKMCCKSKSGDDDTKVIPVEGTGLVRHSTMKQDEDTMKANNINASFLRPCKFRAGVLHLMLNQNKSSIAMRARTFVVADIVGDFKQTFAQIDINGDGSIERDELIELLKELTGTMPTDGEVTEAMKDMGVTDSKSNITLEMFQKWYVESETRVSKQARDAFDEIDKDGSGEISQKEMEQVLRTLVKAQNPSLSKNEIVEKTREEVLTVLKTFGHVAKDDEAKDVHEGDFAITFEEFMTWYKDSMLFEHQLKLNAEQLAGEEDGGEGEEPISLAFPDQTGARIMYLITFPIMICLVATVPDVRNDKWKNWFVVSFIVSILWIGVFSFLMVWWATIIGLVANIPDTIMGLTFLAAGTSIPDLLTSVIVARQGLGDMAVSSSVGSNIFDILVGLPIPWLAYSAVNKGKAMRVYSESLFVSVMTLVGMLAAVVATIALCKWKMSKGLGAIMFFLYACFLASDLARANWSLTCVLVD